MRQISLRIKIILALLGMMVLLGLSLIVLAETVLSGKLYAKLEKRGLSIARSIARDSVTPMLTEDFVGLALMFRDIEHEEKDVAYIYSENTRGEVVAHTFDSGFPTELLHNERDAPDGNGLYRVRRLSTERGTIREISVPLLKGGAGIVHLGILEASINRDVNEIIALIIGAIAGLFLAGSAVAIAFGASLTKPIHLLAVAVQAIERGDLQARVPVRSHDEVGILSEHFNRMAETRMQFEDALLTSEKKLRNITSHLAEGLYVLDKSATITFMNPEAERLLGWTMAELNEKGAHELVHFRTHDGKPLAKDACEMHDVTRTGKRYASTDEVFVRKDGTVFPIAVVCSPILENGSVVASVTAFRDISRQKELEQEREQLLLAYEDALSNIKTLKGLLPICASCKKIRDDKGYWSRIETYIHEHSEAEFSHGICPDCAQKLYPEYYKKSEP